MYNYRKKYSFGVVYRAYEYKTSYRYYICFCDAPRCCFFFGFPLLFPGTQVHGPAFSKMFQMLRIGFVPQVNRKTNKM